MMLLRTTLKIYAFVAMGLVAVGFPVAVRHAGRRRRWHPRVARDAVAIFAILSGLASLWLPLAFLAVLAVQSRRKEFAAARRDAARARRQIEERKKRGSTCIQASTTFETVEKLQWMYSNKATTFAISDGERPRDEPSGPSIDTGTSSLRI